MKSNQERSNECLPPKKREILALEEKQVLVSAAVSESQSGENLAWLASVASMASMAHIPNNAGSNNAVPDSPSPSNKALTVVTEYPPTSTSAGFSISSGSSAYRGVFSGPTVLTANPAVLSTSLPQTIGSVQYAQLPPNLQLIGPYTSYFSSQIVPSTTSPTQPRRTPHEVLATTAVISQASSIDSHSQHVISAVPNVSHSQCIQVESAPLGLTVSSPTAQLPLQIHPHSSVLASHGLAIAPSQVVLHYADGFIAKQPDPHPRELQNGALGEVTLIKNSTTLAKGIFSQSETDQNHKHNNNLGLQTQAQVLIPADYSSHDRGGLQTSVMLVSSTHLAGSSNTELQSILGKEHSSLHLTERGSICLGKPMTRVSSVASLDNQVSSASIISPHTLLQSPHNAPQQELPTSLYSAAQLPIIGYITSAASGPQQAVTGYQSNLPQHMVISGSPSLFIPVSATNINQSSAEPEVTRCSVIPSVANASTALHQSFINTAPPAAKVLSNGKDIPVSDTGNSPCVIQSPSQIQLPVLSASVVGSPVPITPPASNCPHSSPSSPSAGLPPFFMKGSIIQLADGELKRVEDLRTEDFVQSAEVSGELKIDSSTVERIECSRTPNAVIIQFSVGENKAQVCVEVLVEYPFFVFGQGWSSCCPDRTTQLLALSCAKLCVGDVCISLTLKSLKNSFQKKDDFSDSMMNHNSPHIKATKSNGPTDSRPTQMENRKRGCKLTPGEENSFTGTLSEASNHGNVSTLSKNCDVSPLTMVNHQDQVVKTYTSSAEREVSRKRRWSAPENGEGMRSKEDPPSLPKFSFLTHQVKVSIEGHSRIGP